MTEIRWDLIHDAVITDDEPETGCGAKAWEVSGADPCTQTWIPCQKPHLHIGEHWSTSGCAGGNVYWNDEPDMTGSDCA